MAVALDGEALEPRAGAGPLDADAGVGAEDRSVGGTDEMLAVLGQELVITRTTIARLPFQVFM